MFSKYIVLLAFAAVDFSVGNVSFGRAIEADRALIDGVLQEPTRPSLTETQLHQIVRAVAIDYGFNPDTSKGQIAQTWVKKLLSEPVVINHFSTLQRDEDLRFVARRLVLEGVPLLPDSYLKKKMELTLRMLNTATLTECAQIAGHSRYGVNDQGAALRAVLPRLTEAEVSDFMEIMTQAVLVRLRQPEFAPYGMSLEEAVDLMEAISQAVPAAERDGWLSRLERSDALIDSV